MKVCKTCLSQKPLAEFHRDGSRKDGRRAVCRACATATSLGWYEANRDRQASRMAGYYEQGREQWLARSAQWARERRDLKGASVAKRRAAVRKAVPPWFGEFDHLVFAEAYDLAARREALTGEAWHVDHTVPLQGKTVCGLHVAQNVTVIPARQNLAKGNRF